jgi:hypothetical protein
MEPIQSVVSSAVASVVRPAPLSPEKVLFAWRAAVGPAVARVTRVRLAGERVLDVTLDDVRFADELARSAPIVLCRLQQLLGSETVGRMSVRLLESQRSGRRWRRTVSAPQRKGEEKA